MNERTKAAHELVQTSVNREQLNVLSHMLAKLTLHTELGQQPPKEAIEVRALEIRKAYGLPILRADEAAIRHYELLGGNSAPLVEAAMLVAPKYVAFWAADDTGIELDQLEAYWEAGHNDETDSALRAEVESIPGVTEDDLDEIYTEVA